MTRNRAPRPTYEPLGEAAARHSTSTRTLRRMAARGELTLYRFGGQLRVRTDEVDRLAKPLRRDEVSA